jgi:hypothetical protein
VIYANRALIGRAHLCALHDVTNGIKRMVGSISLTRRAWSAGHVSSFVIKELWTGTTRREVSGFGFGLHRRIS